MIPADTVGLYDYANYTSSALEDELYYTLSSHKRCVSGENRDKCCKMRNYSDQAENIIESYKSGNPIQRYTINLSDLKQSFPEDLRSIINIVTNVVSRILKDVDPQFYKVSKIRDKIRWKFIA